MHTVVETPPYLRAIQGLFNEEEQREIVDLVASDAECGEVMPGTGGFRKVRFARAGMGKRGGARIVYIVRGRNMPVFLITAYAKNTKGNLSKAERNELSKTAEALFRGYRRGA